MKFGSLCDKYRPTVKKRCSECQVNLLVSGAASGIGRALAERFARGGHNVFAVDRDAAGLDRLAAEHPSIAALQLDVRDAEAWKDAAQKCVARFGGIDVL